MANKTGRSPKQDSKITANGRPKVEWKGYVTFTLTEEAKTALRHFMSIGSDPLHWLEEIAAEGVYEIKVRWDSYNECYVCNIYCIKYGHVNAGWTLPVRAADYWECQRRAAFVHREVLQGQWGVGEQKVGWTDDKW